MDRNELIDELCKELAIAPMLDDLNEEILKGVRRLKAELAIAEKAYQADREAISAIRRATAIIEKEEDYGDEEPEDPVVSRHCAHCREVDIAIYDSVCHHCQSPLYNC